MPYIGNSPEHITTGQKVVYKYIATAGQTVFTGTDASSNPLTITSKDTIDVFYNGVRLINVDDYTRTTDQVTLVATSTVGDEIIIISIASFQDADHYTKLEVDGVVNTSISDLIDTAPATLNTLNELAAAIGDDPSHVATMTTLIDTKLSLTGGTLTGSLNVNGFVNATGSGTSGGYQFADGNAMIYRDSDDMSFKLQGSEKLRITSSGNVGIGTSSLYGKTTIEHSSGINNGLTLSVSDATQDGNITGIQFSTTSTVSRPRAAIYAVSTTKDVSAGWAADLVFATRGAADGSTIATSDERMRIDQNGNVGIGTNSPTSHLHLWKNGGTSIVCDSNQSKFEFQSANQEAYINMTGTGNITFRMGSGYATKLTLDSNGTVTANAFVGDGSGLTGIASTLATLSDVTVTTSDPTISSNKPVGHLWINTTSGETYVCTDATPGFNVWTNTGGGSGDVIPLYNIDYLVVAGGGGTGGGTASKGGGGAGGYRNSYNSEISGGGGSSESGLSIALGTVYTITVGAGGAHQNSGGLSEITGSNITDVISSGGGDGGDRSNYASKHGANGGSGGGGGTDGGSPYGNVVGNGGTGTSGQGYAGGTGQHVGGSWEGGGGGGGASQIGENGTNANRGGDGGNGQSSSITGSAVTRAGGGGGGGNGTGSGGTGGGGTGSNGSTNLGGGGGANYGSEYSGGSGVVILRMLTTKYSGTTTGSPVVTTDGTYKVLTFNGDGSYTG